MASRNWQNIFLKGQGFSEQAITQFSSLEVDVATALAFVSSGTLPVFNVKTAPYSAVGNGITDDLAAIQAAITAAAAAGGGIVFLPTGTYLISNKLDMVAAQKVTLCGPGGLNVSYPAAATIKASTTFPATTPMISVASTPNLDAQVTIRDLYLDCNSKAQDGVLGSNAGGIYCRRVTVRTALRDSFHFTGGGVLVGNNECFDCYSNNAVNAAYYVDNVFSRFIRCICDNGLYGAYVVGNGGDVLIEGCHFEGATTSGIYIGGSVTTPRIIGNLIQCPSVVTATAGINIATTTATGATIMGNRVNGPAVANAFGIVTAAQGTKIIGNECAGYDVGIYVGAQACLVTSNRVTSATSAGIKNDAAAGNASIIAENIVTGTAVSVSFISGGDVIYAMNRCTGTEPTSGKLGFYGAAPVVRAAAIASPTAPSAGYVQAEAAAMKTAVDAIRVALSNLGLTA